MEKGEQENDKLSDPTPLEIRSVTISKDFRYCLTGGGDGLKLWDIKSGEKIMKLCSDPDYYATSVMFLPDQRYAISINYSGVRIWDLSTGKCLRMYEDFSQCHLGDDIPSFWTSALSPDGQFFLGSHDYSLSVWNVSSGKEIKTLERSGRGAPHIAMSHNGRYFIEGDIHRLSIWDIYTNDFVSYYLPGEIWRVTFSPDDRFILLGYDTGLITLWDVVRKKENRAYIGHSDLITSVVYVNDSHFLSGSKDGSIKLWDVFTGRIIRTFTGHLNYVWSLATNGLILLSGGCEGVKAWDLTTGLELASFVEFIDDSWIVMTPDGYYNASENGDQHLSLNDKISKMDNYRKKYNRPDLVSITLAKPYS